MGLSKRKKNELLYNMRLKNSNYTEQVKRAMELITDEDLCDEIIRTTYATKLFDWRERNGLTVQDIALQFGVSHTIITNTEKAPRIKKNSSGTSVGID